MNKKELEREIEQVKKELKEAQQKNSSEPQQGSSIDMIRIVVNQEVNRILGGLTEKVKNLEDALSAMELEAPTPEETVLANTIEVPISSIDAEILNFIGLQPHSMASADQVRDHMKYRGKNAACARLRRLNEKGIVKRLQLGHKVYYKYYDNDAGKATKTLIVSPPQ